MSELLSDRVPDVIRLRIRLRLPEAQRAMFDEVMAWEDRLVEAFNIASEAADRMATALEAIEEHAECSIGDRMLSKHDAFCIYHTAHSARFPNGEVVT